VALTASAAEGWQTINLLQFTNCSIFELRKPSWLLPHGEQVFDGVPFQMHGIMQVGGLDWVPQLSDLPVRVNAIPVGRAFDRLHLLTASVGAPPPESNVVARVWLDYGQGPEAKLELRFGDQIRNWNPMLHQGEKPLRDSNHSAQAWVALSADSAKDDRYTRLYHIKLENPRSAEVVQSLAIETVVSNCALIVAGLTVGPAEAALLANTYTLPAMPFPDTRKRSGDSEALTGVVLTWEGQPLSNACVRVLAEREMGTQEWRARKLNSLANVYAMTDADGRFQLPPLPDNKLYHLLVVAPGFGSTMFNGADPKSGPIQIRLQEKAFTTNAFNVLVKVVDTEGRPVFGALAEREGVRHQGGTSWGSSEGFPDFAVADERGEFTFGRAKPFSALQMTITAPGFAPNKCWVEVSNVVQTVAIDAGARLHGRVLKDGQPLRHVTIGVSGVERNSEVYVGNFTATTDTNGVYEFEHLPARKSFWLYGTMDSLKAHGAIRPRQILSAAVGESTNDVDLEVGPGLRLAGRVQTRHGEPLPNGLQLSLSVEHWDSQSTKVDTNGNFAFTGLAAGLVEVSFHQSKWRLSPVNRSFDDWGNHELVGMLQQDRDDFLVVIEPGEHSYSYSNNGQLPAADQVRARPIYGAEPTGPYPITLAGQVLDDATGKPISKFVVVPGRKPPVTRPAVAPTKPLLQQIAGAFRRPTTPWNEMPWWDSSRKDTFTNGNFSLDFVPLTSAPMFRVEAAGYEVFISEPMATNTTNLVIRLISGSGPSGIVLAPDGKPAPGATLWYAVSREQASLRDRQLEGYGMRQGLQTNDADGRFTFQNRPEGRKLFVAHTNGWAALDVNPGDKNLKVQLEAWAVVKGSLVTSNSMPKAGIRLHLTHPYDWNNGDPILNIQGVYTTDARGEFLFTNAMPGRLDLIREIPVGGNGYSHGPQTWFICQPGVTNDLGNVIFDTPPPPPLSEKVKRALGL
jgi:protocatechuate 3,4-dioxygenase beta subunit